MEFGLQFFPVVAPEEKAAARYWNEALDLVALCDELGYVNVRTVEHYFLAYGGYSPNPMLFLAAASQRTRRARLVTGAILPIFNHPLKMAGEIGMLDAISGGRLEVGFARAFLPHEFARFGRSLDESRDRFDEGLAQVTRLLEEENVTCEGRFHSFRNVTSLPRPTQTPRPPFWVAVAQTEESFANAGRLGHSIMCHPAAADKLKTGIEVYRDAWRAAGHPGRGRVMVAFQMFCAETAAEAYETAAEAERQYRERLAAAASDWTEGTVSDQYRNYDRLIRALRDQTFDKQVAGNMLWIGTPAELRERIRRYDAELGGFEIASLQVNFHMIPVEAAARSMRLFANEVMPRFRAAG